jgi:DNA-directed RNA polymerase specialized sigma subunit
MRSIYEKVTRIATETELGLKSTGTVLAQEVATVVGDVTKQIQEPLNKAEKQRTLLSSMIQKSREERQILQKSIARAEQLAKFFDKKIPYEEVLEAIEDKKYLDARFLLSKGLSSAQVAAELGLPESDVSLIASVG